MPHKEDKSYNCQLEGGIQEEADSAHDKTRFGAEKEAAEMICLECGFAGIGNVNAVKGRKELPGHMVLEENAKQEIDGQSGKRGSAAKDHIGPYYRE